MRQIGVSFKPCASGKRGAVPAIGAVKLIDISTGEELDGVASVTAKYEVGGAIVLKVKLFPNAVIPWDETI